MADDFADIVNQLDRVMADSAYVGLNETWTVGVWTPVKRTNKFWLSNIFINIITIMGLT